MKITILNGDPEMGKLDTYLGSLSGVLSESGNDAEILTLRDMDIKFCTGCFGCWVKTPGNCLTEDDTDMIRRELINTDMVIYASPVKMGFISALLKSAIDKRIPNLLPYMHSYKGEVHHVKRYDKYPDVAVILDEGDDCDAEDIGIIKSIFERNSIHTETTLHFVHTLKTSPEEMANEINNL